MGLFNQYLLIGNTFYNLLQKNGKPITIKQENYGEFKSITGGGNRILLNDKNDRNSVLSLSINANESTKTEIPFKYPDVQECDTMWTKYINDTTAFTVTRNPTTNKSWIIINNVLSGNHISTIKVPSNIHISCMYYSEQYNELYCGTINGEICIYRN